MSRVKAKRPATKASRLASAIRQHVEAQRRRLLGADAIVVCVQHALDSQLGAPDELRVVDALQVASDIINDAVEALEPLTS